jgi:hypothetical protein
MKVYKVTVVDCQVSSVKVMSLPVIVLFLGYGYINICLYICIYIY